jgi:uncharacterized protein YkwD
MNLKTAMRPAQRILTGTIVAAIASTCVFSAATTTSAAGQNGSDVVSAKKEYRIGAPAKKEYKGHAVTPAKKEYKGYAVTPAKKEYKGYAVTPAKKEYKGHAVTPAKKEYKKEHVSPFALVAQTASPALSTDTYERRVVKLVNARRHRYHLRALTTAPCAERVANRWSAHLASTGSFHHQSMQKLLRRCDAHYVGETLGRGAMTPATLVNLWMHSAPHRHVLLSHNPRRIGVGATPNAQGEWVVAANFMRF